MRQDDNCVFSLRKRNTYPLRKTIYPSFSSTYWCGFAVIWDIAYNSGGSINTVIDDCRLPCDFEFLGENVNPRRAFLPRSTVILCLHPDGACQQLCGELTTITPTGVSPQNAVVFLFTTPDGCFYYNRGWFIFTSPKRAYLCCAEVFFWALTPISFTGYLRFNHGYTKFVCKTYLVEDRPIGGQALTNSYGEIHGGSAVLELPCNESDYAQLVEGQTTLPLVYPPTRWIRKDMPLRPCSFQAASVLRNRRPKSPNTLPSHEKLPPQASKPLKVFGNPMLPMRRNTLPSRLKFPSQAAKQLKVSQSNQNIPSISKCPPQGVKLKVYATQTSDPLPPRIVLDDLGRMLRDGFCNLRAGGISRQ